MLAYIVRRLLLAIPTLAIISVLAFVIIQLPPGDYLDQRIAQLQQQNGDASSLAQADALRHRYGLDKPMAVRYIKWVSGFVRGDFGESFKYQKEVKDLIGERMALTIALALASLLLTYAIAVPIGIYSATHKYQWTDNVLTLAAFVGMSLPSFLIALVILVLVYKTTGQPLFGLFSPAYDAAPWSLGKLGDLFKHIWIPMLVIAVNGTAGLMRIMRGNLLDVLGEPFVRTARAKGLPETVVVVKHAARIAVNPLISIIGMSLPDLLSGTTIVSIVLGLPTIGPMLFTALQDEDMYLAGTIILFMSLLLIVGNLLADIALAWADPRIRYE